MRILHLIGSPHLGGAEVVCLNLVAALRARGVDARLFALADGKPVDAARGRGLPVTVAELAGRPGESRGKRWHRLGLALLAEVATVKPELVHSHVPITNLICHRTLPARRIPWVCTIHSSWRIFGYTAATINRPYLRPYLMLRHAVGDGWMTRSAARIAANSQYVARELKQIGVSAGRIDVVYNGLDCPTPVGLRDEIRRAWNVPADDLVIGAMGHLSPVKGFDLLIRAFALLAPDFPRLRLRIAGGDVLGDCTQREQLLGLLRDANLLDRADVSGVADPDREFLPALDIFAVTSRSEGFSLALLQAMWHGLPAVITSAGGCGEVARPNQESLMYDSPNVRSLAAALRSLLANPNLARSLGQAARLRAEAMFSLAACADNYMEFYRKSLSQKVR